MLSESLFNRLKAPLLSYSNAVLSFEIQSDTPSLDSEGNWEFPTTTLELNAIAHPKQTLDGYFSGSDRKSLMIRGRLTDPLVFPDSVKHLARGRITINGRQGEFTLHFLTQNPYTQNALGQEFEGIFNES